MDGSSTRPGTSCALSPHRDDAPFDRPSCPEWPRSICTWGASSTRSCTCCTPGSSSRCCTTWAGRVRRAVPPDAQPGPGHQRARRCPSRWATASTWAQQLDPHGVDAIRLTMLFAGPPDDDIDWADVSPGRRSSSWPGPGGWPATSPPGGARPRDRGDGLELRASPTAPSTRSRRLVEAFRLTWPSPG